MGSGLSFLAENVRVLSSGNCSAFLLLVMRVKMQDVKPTN